MCNGLRLNRYLVPRQACILSLNMCNMFFIMASTTRGKSITTKKQQNFCACKTYFENIDGHYAVNLREAKLVFPYIEYCLHQYFSGKKQLFPGNGIPSP